MDLLDALKSEIIVADGAMGTVLLDKGISRTQCFEQLCINSPDLILGIHQSYLDAGARIIGTNSFGANALRLARYGLENHVNEFNWQAAQLARQATKGTAAWAAGCVGPLGTRNHQELTTQNQEEIFQQQIGALLDGGVQLIQFETFQNLAELRLALHIKHALHHCPAICSLSCGENGYLADGTSLQQAMKILLDEGADIVGINCVSGPRAAIRLLQHLTIDAPVAVSPNAGRPYYFEGRYIYETNPDYFAAAAIELAELGANIIGGCCGTTPKHIQAMAAAIHGRKPKVRPVAVVVAHKSAEISPPPIGPTILDKLAAGQRVIITELDPPKNLRLERYFEAARHLVDAGSDAITLADNSLAILRVSNLAIGALLKQQGITPLLHVSCRDRNVLGLQSELMGMAALGIHHILPVTGDPAKVGDHPGATSVYDVTSIGLIEIIRQMNLGHTQAGTDLKQPTRFVIGCSFNPNVKNLGAQISRLERKAAAGAQFVMTQPIFDPSLAKSTIEITRHLNIPIFLGVWPLINGRQAVFLHNEVPGISIPPLVLERMHGKEGLEGKQEGLNVAKEILDACLEVTNAIYLMTPFQAYELTAELARYIRNKN